MKNEKSETQAIIEAIAEIKDITQRVEESTNGINYRLDNLESDIQNVKKTAIVGGGLAGGIVSVGIELARLKLGL